MTRGHDVARLIRHLILLVATGLVGAALVAPPAGAAPTWQPVTNLFADLSAAGGSAQTPAVAVDSRGDATAIWTRWNGAQPVVQASTRPAGGTWSAPVDLAQGRSIFNPQLTVDPAGNATAVWRVREVDRSVVQASTRPPGGAWSTPVDLSVDTSVDPSQLTDVPQVAVDAAGIVTATWSRFEAKPSEAFKHVVQAATRLTDGTWTAPVDLSAPGQYARTTDLAVDPAGNATVIWVAGSLVQTATRPAGGTWGAPVDVSTIAGPRANPRIVVDPGGTATAVWGTFTTTYGIQTATRAPGGAWTAPADLSAPGQDTFDTPELAADRRGTVTALWQRHDGSGWIVTSATRPAGGAWTTPVDLSATGHDAWDPQVAVDPAGNATAVWSLADEPMQDSARTVQAARRTAAGEWTAPVDLSRGGTAWNPQVALDSFGNATTVWSHNDGSGYVVEARGLDAAGPVVTSLTGQAMAAGRTAYAVTAYDAWSRVGSVSWAFGDGTTATGTSVTHRTAGDSSRPVKVTLTDRVGNATVCTYAATYTCRTSRRGTPTISKASLSHRTIRADDARSDARKKARLKVVLTTDAKVELVFKRAGTKKKIRVTKRGEAGKNAFTVRARLGKKKVLRPGRWVISVRATNKAGTSAKKKLRMRVVR
jgi:hypothetical protein